MLAYERKSRIIRYLEQYGRAEVNELANLLSVVPETIRRDLRELEGQGVLNRTHGGAVMSSRKDGEYPVQIRVMKNAVEKEKICRRAASFIEDGDMIFIDNSSTLINLIKFIDGKLQLTILTNSLEVLHEFSTHYSDNITMICTGGVFNRNNMSLSGLVSGKNAFGLFPQKAFVSCHGISTAYGFTDGNLFELGFKREMISIAKQVLVLADHDKFGTRGPFHLGGLDICDILISDREPEEEFLQELRTASPGMEIVIAG